MREMNGFPEVRPICALCVVEDYAKCPEGYSVIRYTQDAKAEADLWRDGYSLFARRKTRYLCYARASEQEDSSYIVESISVLSEGDPPPSGYTIIQATKDTGQRALKKKLMCYRLVQYNQSVQAVYEIALLSSTKRTPDGYVPAGDLDGIQLWFKVGPGRGVVGAAPLPYSLPTAGGTRVYPPLDGTSNGSASAIGAAVTSNGGPPGSASSVTSPSRRAPAPPPRPGGQDYENLADVNAGRAGDANANDPAQYGIGGVPFELSNSVKLLGRSRSVVLPEIKVFTEDSWKRDEFKYDFRTEKDVMSAGYYTIRR